jgi:nitroimidazol reductase NimA-like FMN-containing flavoprotein (pyridoxamine 5'-phosphate oxidase superfamily)
MIQTAPTKRTQVNRLPKRGDYTKETIHSILDAAFLCHVGFAVEGQPYVIPTGYGRNRDTLYLHGSAASRMLRNLEQGIDICVTVTLLDGIVLARAAFHHSMNYRSVVILGRAALITETDAKLEALRIISEQIIPGRWNDARLPTPQELKATTVMAVPIEEASAKVRTGPPVDDEEDYGLNMWAGVLPLGMKAGAPVRDPRLAPNVQAVPEYVLQYGKRLAVE